MSNRVFFASVLRRASTSLVSGPIPFGSMKSKRIQLFSTAKETTSKAPPKKDWTAITNSYETYGKYLQSLLPRFVTKVTVYKDELTLFVEPEDIIPVVSFLRDHNRCQFKQVIDICGVDYPGRPNRFEVVYHLLSVHSNTRIRLKTYASETSTVPS